jgi:hypothetical protein
MGVSIALLMAVGWKMYTTWQETARAFPSASDTEAWWHERIKQTGNPMERSLATGELRVGEPIEPFLPGTSDAIVLHHPPYTTVWFPGSFRELLFHGGTRVVAVNGKLHGAMVSVQLAPNSFYSVQFGSHFEFDLDYLNSLVPAALCWKQDLPLAMMGVFGPAYFAGRPMCD